MDNREFVENILNHRYISLYHSLIVSAQQGYLSKNAIRSDKQIAKFSIEQAQETIKTLGYVNSPDD